MGVSFLFAESFVVSGETELEFLTMGLERGVTDRFPAAAFLHFFGGVGESIVMTTVERFPLKQ